MPKLDDDTDFVMSTLWSRINSNDSIPMQKLRILELNSGKVFKPSLNPNIPLENKRLTLSALFLWEAG